MKIEPSAVITSMTHAQLTVIGFGEPFTKLYTLQSVLASLRDVTPEMLKSGAHISSEWFNDNAPIGESAYQPAAKSGFRAMLDQWEKEQQP